jgi:phage tail-like protein
MMAYYPSVAFSFAVGLDGGKECEASFAEVIGLDADTSAVGEGGEGAFTHRVPGQLKSSTLVLKRGVLLARSALFCWCKDMLEADLEMPIKSKTLTIELMDNSGKPLMRWQVINAWPVKWSGASFDMSTSQVTIETLELAHQRVERQVNSRPSLR